MSMTSIFKVIYHYESGSYGGKPHGLGWRTDHIAAADGNPATLAAVLVSNGKGAPAAYVITFDSIANEGAGSLLS